jgi:conjugal transfer pilin signal peptidase TrbI
MLKLSGLKDSKNLKLFLFFFPLILCGSLIPSRLSVSLTPSLDHRLFFLDRSPDPCEIKKNDYVLFTFSSRYLNDGKPVKAIKQVACDEGEILKVTGNDYYCNDIEFIGKAKDYSLKEEKLEKFVYDGKVPEGYVFVAGRHKDSFDSRYYGFIKKKDIKAIAYPLW